MALFGNESIDNNGLYFAGNCKIKYIQKRGSLK